MPSIGKIFQEDNGSFQYCLEAAAHYSSDEWAITYYSNDKTALQEECDNLPVYLRCRRLSEWVSWRTIVKDTFHLTQGWVYFWWSDDGEFDVRLEEGYGIPEFHKERRQYRPKQRVPRR